MKEYYELVSGVPDAFGLIEKHLNLLAMSTTTDLCKIKEMRSNLNEIRQHVNESIDNMFIGYFTGEAQ